MIAKKNSRIDLEKKRIVLFQIGLLTAGSFTLAAFTWTSPQASMNDVDYVAYNGQTTNVEFQVKEEPEPEILEVPKQEPIDQPQSSTLQTNEISEKIEKSKNTDKVQKTDITVKGILPPGGDVDEYVPDYDIEKIEEFPPVPAEYIGGYPAMVKRIMDVLVYPEIDIDLGNQGKVFASFVIETDGSVSNIKIERGVSPTINREAKRIIRSFPKWKPAENMYGKVRTRVRLPINFKIEG